MPTRFSVKNVRTKVVRKLKRGMMPLEIAQKLGIPLLLVAEVVMLETAIRQAAANMDL